MNKHFMHTITLQINNNIALKALQSLKTKKFISILEDSEIGSPALPGAALSLTEFKEWIADAEQAPLVSLNDAKQIWADKRKRLQQLTK